jgi:hypothetical protein
MFTFSRVSAAKDCDSTGLQTFPYPITPCPRIAVFPPYFAPERLDLATASTIAAPIQVIREIDADKWTPEFPMIVFSGLGESFLSDEDRDFIWNTFGVPVFEYLLDRDGRILARECEAHDGLHFDCLPEPCRAEIIEESCACGAPGARLMKLDAIIVENESVRMWRNWQTRQI